MNKNIVNKMLDIIYFLAKISLVLMGVYIGIMYLFFMIINISNPSIFESSFIVTFNAMIIILLIVWFLSYCDNKKINNNLVNKIYKTINHILYFTSIIGCFFLTFMLILMLSGIFIYNDPINIIELLVFIIIPYLDLIMSKSIFNKKIRYIFYLYTIIVIVFSCFYNLQTNGTILILYD